MERKCQYMTLLTSGDGGPAYHFRVGTPVNWRWT